MKDRKVFTDKLGAVLQMAMNQNGRIALSEVEAFFAEDSLSEEQMGLVCDYLMSQRVLVSGYVPKGGTVHVKEENQGPVLSTEEKNYLETYLYDISNMPAGTKEEARLAYYLPKIVDEALAHHTGEVYIGDLIQEGNMAMMMAFMETEEILEEEVMELVRGAIRTEATAQSEVLQRDKRMVSKVSELDETIKQMADAANGKVSVDEVADSLGITENDIADILKLAGETVDNGESDEESEDASGDINDMMTVLNKEDVIDLQDPEGSGMNISWDDDDDGDDDVVF